MRPNTPALMILLLSPVALALGAVGVVLALAALVAALVRLVLETASGQVLGVASRMLGAPGPAKAPSGVGEGVAPAAPEKRPQDPPRHP